MSEKPNRPRFQVDWFWLTIIVAIVINGLVKIIEAITK